MRKKISECTVKPLYVKTKTHKFDQPIKYLQFSIITSYYQFRYIAQNINFHKNQNPYSNIQHFKGQYQMKAFGRLVRPLVYTTVGLGAGLGGYYWYNTYQVKDVEGLQGKSILNLQMGSSNLAQLLNHQNPQNMDTQEQSATEQQKQQHIEKQQGQTKNNQSPQKVSQKPQQKTIQQQQQAQKKAAQQLSPQTQQSKTNKTNHNLDISKIQRFSQIPELPSKLQHPLNTVLIVSDIGFTQQFQQKLLNTIKNIKKMPQTQHILIYRVNTQKQQVRQQFHKELGHKLKDQTIFLIKNELDKSFVDIDFDMYMQYPAVIGTYMTKLKLYDINSQKQYLKKLQKMSPNESYLMFIYDDSQVQEKRSQCLLAAKYIQMQLALHHLDHVIKVLPVQASLVHANNLIKAQLIRPKSLHIIRKHNQFTHANPNLYLKFGDQTAPYHILPNIGFHNKRGQVAVQSYLSKIQTFNSLSVTTPYILSLTIDRNRITTDNYRQLMTTFKEIKRKNKHPQVSVALKFAEVEYLGKNHAQTNQFTIKMANVAELQNQSYIHEIQKQQDSQSVGITQQNWLKQSFQYLYSHQVVSEDLITDFIQKVLHKQVPQYYRSDKPSSIQNVHKIVGSNFDKQILQNGFDHFVFEYSQHCPSCKMISPLIGYMNELLEAIPIQARFDIHRMNCQKNRIRNQTYSPYTPNMNYYKNEWKHAGPVRINLQTISHGGLAGLYDFCVITKTLKTVDTLKFNQTIQNAKAWDKAQFLL